MTDTATSYFREVGLQRSTTRPRTPITLKKSLRTLQFPCGNFVPGKSFWRVENVSFSLASLSDSLRSTSAARSFWWQSASFSLPPFQAVYWVTFIDHVLSVSNSASSRYSAFLSFIVSELLPNLLQVLLQGGNFLLALNGNTMSQLIEKNMLSDLGFCSR